MLYKWRKDYEQFGSGSFPGKGTLKQTPDQKIISELEAKKTLMLISQILDNTNPFAKDLFSTKN